MDQGLFSLETRAKNLDVMSASSPPLDVLVIGGGITGAGIARDAARRGFRVGLVERKDFAAGTSSRSSKLIHGGVRYLQLGHFRVVRESAHERQILGRIAPHLVRPLPMVIPAHSRRSQFVLNLGLSIYDRLGSIVRSERHQVWDRETTLAHVPLLRPERIHGAIAYFESTTDDARLVLETIKDAHVGGALIANYASVTVLHVEGGRIGGVQVHDAVGDGPVDIRARVVVNAAGPWVDAVRQLDGPLPGKHLRLTKGIHLTLPRDCLPVDQIVAFRARDRRTTFVVPRGDVVYVGTTDTDYHEPTDHPDVTTDDVAYLLEAVNRTFSGTPIDASQVCSSWAGLRPLMHEDGKSPSEISRKDEIMVAPTGLISIAGGKLTTYRSMARRVVDLVRDALTRLGHHVDAAPCTTDRVPLPGGDASYDELRTLEHRLADEHADIPRAAIARLVATYGTQSETVLQALAAEPDLGQPVGPGSPLIGAEVRFALDHEMALTLEDVLDRRTRLLLFARDQGLGALEATATLLARRLHWSTERRDAEIASYRDVAARLRPARNAGGVEPAPSGVSQMSQVSQRGRRAPDERSAR
jgi:glycerol-3-phosphate dehydrogenase